MRLQVRLTFGQILGQVFIVLLWSDIPLRRRHLVAKCDTTLGQVDIWLDVPPMMRLCVRLTFGQTLGQVDL